MLNEFSNPREDLLATMVCSNLPISNLQDHPQVALPMEGIVLNEFNNPLNNPRKDLLATMVCSNLPIGQGLGQREGV